MAAYLSGIPFYDSNRPGEIISPTVINPYSAMTIPAFWRAVNFLADNLSSFPRAVHMNGSPAEANNPLNKILKRKPNAYQNCTQFWRTFFGHAANYGNAYAMIARDMITNGVNSLHNLLPDNVWPFRYDADDGQGPLQYYYIRTTKKILLSADVLHISALSYDGMMGHDVVWMHRESLQRGVTLDRFMTKFLVKGTVMRGAIEIPNSASTEQVEELIATIRKHFRGADGDRDVMVLTDGAKLNNATLTPEESKLIEIGAYTTKQIAQITGVPPQFLYEFTEQKYNGSSIEQVGQDVVRYTFRPWIEQTEDELTIKLLTDAEQDAGYEIKLDPNALIRGDTTTTVTTAVAKKNAGIQTANEARHELGLAPSTDPEADKLKTSGDTTPKAPAPPTPPRQNARPASAEQFATKEHLQLSHFSDLIADAANRVHKKTAKAVDAAQKRFADNAADWAPWCNVFTQEQGAYATVTVAPVLTTFANLSGKMIDGMAAKAGQKYAQQLGAHLIQVGKKQDTTPPDLAAIVLELGGDNGPTPEPRPDE